VGLGLGNTTDGIHYTASGYEARAQFISCQPVDQFASRYAVLFGELHGQSLNQSATSPCFFGAGVDNGFTVEFSGFFL
jgi:hypothetical protein